MTFDQIELELEKPENKKYSKYLNSFWSLTDDEQDRVVAKHKGFAYYLALFEEHTRLMCEMLSKALQVSVPYGSPGSLTAGSALQIEDLEATLKLVTFDEKHLRFA